ncbi:hypothetical protein [Candidatus Clostridium stratigraminis]|uniref:Auto-transporter adhesin head GIN domain-containing protein n=1 Tax=Candidatus Clostridium stratigraminis TaxID=3381661 RepID=A0ABW8SYK0_9CLOT
MSRLNYPGGKLKVLIIILLISLISVVYGKDKIFVIGSKPFNISRLDTFAENTNKGKSDKISIISISGFATIKSTTLSANEEKIISISSNNLSDKCKVITKTNSDNEIIYSMTSIEKRSAYIILQYRY